MDMEFLMGFLGEAAKTDFGQKVILFMLAWSVVKRTVRQHLEKIEKGLAEVATSVQDLNEAMTELKVTKVSHEARLQRLEEKNQGGEQCKR